MIFVICFVLGFTNWVIAVMEAQFGGFTFGLMMELSGNFMKLK